jgi:putative ABC transport system ATP-binding protein
MNGLSLENARIALADGDRAFELRADAAKLDAGEIVALTGASGSGKTLMLELLGLLRAPAEGTTFTFGERDLGGLWQAGARSPELARARGEVFGFVPQTGGLIPFLTVAENAALPQRITGREDRERLEHVLAHLGLSDVAAMLPAALSIGQRQRTAIARALSHRPSFVIADEPTAALDPESADGVLRLLLETAQEEGAGVILSSHDLDRISRFGLPRWRLDVQADGQSVTSVLKAGQC